MINKHLKYRDQEYYSSYIEYYSGKKYGQQRSAMNCDFFVRHALKGFDREFYDSLFGWTKRQGTVEQVVDKVKDMFGHGYACRKGWTQHQINCYNAAVQRAKAKFKPKFGERFEPADWDAIPYFMKQDTSPGASFIGSKKGEIIDEALALARHETHMIKGDRIRTFRYDFLPAPVMLTSRGHLSLRDDIKIRPVHIFPIERVIQESIFTIPLNKYYLANPDSPMFYGKSIFPRLSEYLRRSRPGTIQIHFDWSKFDSTLPPFLMRSAFDNFFSYMKFDTWEGKPVSKVNQRRWSRLRDFIQDYFIYTPVWMPNGEMLHEKGGLPSGSSFTQLIGSMSNYIVIQTLMNLMGQTVLDMKVLGDDSFVVLDVRSNNRFDLLEFKRLAEVLFGMTLNDKKTKIWDEDSTEYRSFLGYEFRNGTLYKPTEEWFKGALYPERLVRDVHQSFSRLVGYLYIGAATDAKFCRFVDYFQSGYPIKKYRDKGIAYDPDQKKKFRHVLGLVIEREKISELKVHHLAFKLLFDWRTKPWEKAYVNNQGRIVGTTCS